MSTTKQPLSGDAFERKLAELRLRIDSLPLDQRAHLYDLANVVEQHHRQLRTKRRVKIDAD